jgi:hypothetical protein
MGAVVPHFASRLAVDYSPIRFVASLLSTENPLRSSKLQAGNWPIMAFGRQSGIALRHVEGGTMTQYFIPGLIDRLIGDRPYTPAASQQYSMRHSRNVQAREGKAYG